MTAIYSAAHFFVDLACAFLVLGFAYQSDPHIILMYNFCAFALQMPIGIILDKFGRGHRAAAAGCMLIASGYLMVMLPFGEIYMLAAVVAGIGNALFHSGGGVYILDEYDNSGALGVFVSPGAIGLFLGTLWSSQESFPAVMPFAAMLICGAAIWAAPYALKLKNVRGAAAENPLGFSLSSAEKAAAVMFVCVVVIRSFGGFTVPLSWKTTTAASAAAVVAAASGKALGGFLSDKLGKSKASALTMISAALLYLVSDNIICGIAAVLLFNMSMPITLRAAADIFKGGRGFSFGLLTFALFIGFVPVYVDGSLKISHMAMCVLCLLSAVLLTAGFRLCGRGAEKNDSSAS